MWYAKDCSSVLAFCTCGQKTTVKGFVFSKVSSALPATLQKNNFLHIDTSKGFWLYERGMM